MLFGKKHDEEVVFLRNYSKCTWYVCSRVCLPVIKDVTSLRIDRRTVHSGNCGDDLLWAFDDRDGILTINGTGFMTNYTGQNTTRPLWYDMRNSIKRIIINEGALSIGDYAFADCSNVTSVSIPSTVISIGIYAFSKCSSLTSIELPPKLTTIKNYTFYYCTNLMTISIPPKVTELKGYAFAYCGALRNITLPQNLTIIGNYCFYRCFNLTLTSPYIPSTVTKISSHSFDNCRSIESLIIPKSVRKIESYAFCFCIKLKTVILPPDLTSIEQSVFAECYSLANIDIPPNVTTIGENAFLRCSSLKFIEIPSKVTKIESNAFYECRGLKSVILHEGLRIIGGTSTFSGCTNLTSIIIPSSVTILGGNSFSGCKNLKSIIYLGTKNPCVSTSTIISNETSINICVPSNYSGNSFCEREIHKVASEETIESVENDCVEAVCGENELIPKERYNVTEWNDQTNDCREYRCQCDDDGKKQLFTWSKCNATEETHQMCLNEKCVPSDTTMEETLSVVIDLSMSDTSFDISNLTETLIEKKNIEVDESKIGIERDDQGNVVRIVVFLNDRDTAYDIADIMNECSSSSSSSSSSSLSSPSSPSP